MGYIKPLSKAFVKQVALISVISFLLNCFYSFSVYKMPTHNLKREIFSWSVGSLIEPVLFIQQLFPRKLPFLKTDPMPCCKMKCNTKDMFIFK